MGASSCCPPISVLFPLRHAIILSSPCISNTENEFAICNEAVILRETEFNNFAKILTGANKNIEH